MQAADGLGRSSQPEKPAPDACRASDCASPLSGSGARPVGIPSTGRGKGLAWAEWALQQETDECLLWPYSKSSSGYGDFRAMGEHHSAHVYVCTRAHGEPPFPNADAAHSCHTPLCVNKRHLSWKSRLDNMHDKESNGTVLRHEDAPNAILDWRAVKEIRATPRYRGAGVDLAAKFNVHPNTIYAVWNRRSWR